MGPLGDPSARVFIVLLIVSQSLDDDDDDGGGGGGDFFPRATSGVALSRQHHGQPEAEVGSLVH